MQETRTELGAGCDMTAVAHRKPHVLQGLDMRGVAFDIGQQRDIVSGAGSVEMGLEPGAETAVGAGLAQGAALPSSV